MNETLKVLFITSEWPSKKNPSAAPFVVRQVEFLQRAGIEVEVFTFRGEKNITHYLQAWVNAQKKISRGCFDLVHSQWGQSAFPALPKRIPLVVTFRGSDLKGITNKNGQYTFQGRLLSIFSKYISFVADEVILVSENLAMMIPRRNYNIIPSGLDLCLFHPMDVSYARKQLGLSLNNKYILFGGIPTMEIKRIWLAESAILLIKDIFPDVKMIKVDGVEHSRMPLYFNACDVLLLTSEHEGSPNVVKEALACNVPVVSTDVGDVRERIGSIEGCVICEDDHPETIAMALRDVLTRNKRIEGRETVLSLNEEILTQKIISVYEKALT